MSTQRIGLVGAGHRNRQHVRVLYELRDQSYYRCESAIDYPHRIDHDFKDQPRSWAEDITDLQPAVTAIFDPSRQARESVAEYCASHGDTPTLYDEFTAFLASDEIDAVLVASPNQYHACQSVTLLEHGINTLCEKPIATTLEDHDEIIDGANTSNAFYFVGFNLRASPFYTRLYELISHGTVGDVGMISCRESRGHFHADYSFTQAKSGGTLLDKNSHDFDLYNWYADADPVVVLARGNQHVHTKNTDVTDQASIIVEYDNGVIGTLEVCMFAPFGQRVRMYEVRGSEGLLRAPNEADTVTLFKRNSRDTFRVTDTAGSHSGADISQMKRFLRCIQGRATPPASPLDAKKADAVALAGELAIETGEVVEIGDDFSITSR